MNGIVSLACQPSGHPTRQLRIDEEFHTDSGPMGSTRLM